MTSDENDDDAHATAFDAATQMQSRRRSLLQGDGATGSVGVAGTSLFIGRSVAFSLKLAKEADRARRS